MGGWTRSLVIIIAQSHYGEPNMADTTLDTRRLAREQEQNMVEATNVSFNMLKPVMQLNNAALRFYADSFNSWVNNCEKTCDSVMTMIDQQMQSTTRQQRTG
jgi:hypothetical protein